MRAAKRPAQLPSVNPQKSAREALGLTQVEFAALLGVHAITVSKWERGKLDPNTYQQELCRRLTVAARGRWSAPGLIQTYGAVGALCYLLAESIPRSER